MLLIKITAENNVVPKNIPTFLCPLILNVRDYEYLGKGVNDKNRLDLMASRSRFWQSNRKREIETRCHLSRLLVSETRHVKTEPKT